MYGCMCGTKPIAVVFAWDLEKPGAPNSPMWVEFMSSRPQSVYYSHTWSLGERVSQLGTEHGWGCKNAATLGQPLSLRLRLLSPFVYWRDLKNYYHHRPIFPIHVAKRANASLTALALEVS